MVAANTELKLPTFGTNTTEARRNDQGNDRHQSPVAEELGGQ